MNGIDSEDIDGEGNFDGGRERVELCLNGDMLDCKGCVVLTHQSRSRVLEHDLMAYYIMEYESSDRGDDAVCFQNKLL